MSAPQAAFPSLGRLLVFAVLLPAAVAASNQALLKLAAPYYLQSFFYPWLALSTAVLSWCAGCYLRPAWLGWLVFAWGCALLDILTIAVCLGGAIDDHFAFVLVSAQISLVVLWAILETSNWQWRLPGALAVAPAVWGFAAIFTRTAYSWTSRSWFLLFLLTTVVIVVLCGTLRLIGFSLRKAGDNSTSTRSPDSLRPYQFGVKHMMFWAVAMVPLLLVGRGLDFLVLKSLGTPGTFEAVLLALVVAATNLTVIWAILGSGGALILRLIVLISVPLVLAAGVNQYVEYMQSIFMSNPRRYSNLIYGLFSRQVGWNAWLCLDAALLAALLLFLREWISIGAGRPHAAYLKVNGAMAQSADRSQSPWYYPILLCVAAALAGVLWYSLQ